MLFRLTGWAGAAATDRAHLSVDPRLGSRLGPQLGSVRLFIAAGCVSARAERTARRDDPGRPIWDRTRWYLEFVLVPLFSAFLLASLLFFVQTVDGMLLAGMKHRECL